MNNFEKELKNNCPISFHMPGHMNNLRKIKFLNYRIGEIDTTETHNHDNLHNPKTIIRDLQKAISKEYRSIQSYPLVNGSTSGILTALSYLPSNSKILISKDSHISVYNGCELNNITFEYMPENLDELSNKLNDRYNAVLVTTPSYFGVCKDLEKLHSVCQEKHTLLITDFAHGAHLHKLQIKDSYLQHHSDISVTSLHKTLPAITSAAILNIYNKNIDLKRIEKYLSIYQTSSPSYLTLGSIAACIDFLQSNNLYNKLISNITKLFSKLSGLDKLKISTNDDPTRIIISTTGTTISVNELNMRLIKLGIEPEMSDETNVVLICTPCNKNKDFLILAKILRKIDSKVSKTNVVPLSDELPKKKNLFNLAQFKDKPYSLCSPQDSLGKISKGYIGLYPPFVPILLAGETITESFINVYKKYKNKLISNYSDIENDLIAVLDCES